MIIIIIIIIIILIEFKQTQSSSYHHSIMSTNGGIPPPKYVKKDGKMIRNPDYDAFMRESIERHKTNENSDNDSDSDNDNKKEQQILDCDGIEIPPKFVKHEKKTILNPEYVSYMKGGKQNRLTTECIKLNAITSIADLSKDFPLVDPEQPMQTLKCNPGARWIESHFGKMSEVYRVTVVEDGMLVADYRKEGIGPNDTFNLFSTTKGIMSMLIGVVIEQTDLTPQDTLEQVFQNNPNAWSRLQNKDKDKNKNTLEELEYTKSVTIHELLTMTSGLASMVGGVKGIFSMKELSVADAAGSDLPRALAAPQYNPKNRGTFHYMPSSNILSYVIKEKTGMSPLEFANMYVFPKLGINPHRMSWDSNAEGIETSYSQLKLTTYQMCKVGQLYLQDGYPSPRTVKPLFGDDWIDESHKKHVYGQGGFDHWYGYLWSLYDQDFHSNLQAGDIWCAPGFNGQLLAISRETNRVVAISRFPKPMNGETLVRFKKYAIKLLGKTMSYNTIENEKRELNCQIPIKYIRRRDGIMVLNPDYVDYRTEQKQQQRTKEQK